MDYLQSVIRSFVDHHGVILFWLSFILNLILIQILINQSKEIKSLKDRMEDYILSWFG